MGLDTGNGVKTWCSGRAGSEMWVTSSVVNQYTILFDDIPCHVIGKFSGLGSWYGPLILFLKTIIKVFGGQSDSVRVAG